MRCLKESVVLQGHFFTGPFSAKCSGLLGYNQVRMELYDVRRTKFIQAHSSGLAALSLSLNGRLLATASDRGTLVRIYSTADGSKLQVGASHSSTCSVRCGAVLSCDSRKLQHARRCRIRSTDGRSKC